MEIQDSIKKFGIVLEEYDGYYIAYPLGCSRSAAISAPTYDEALELVYSHLNDLDYFGQNRLTFEQVPPQNVYLNHLEIADEDLQQMIETSREQEREQSEIHEVATVEQAEAQPAQVQQIVPTANYEIARLESLTQQANVDRAKSGRLVPISVIVIISTAAAMFLQHKIGPKVLSASLGSLLLSLIHLRAFYDSFKAARSADSARAVGEHLAELMGSPIKVKESSSSAGQRFLLWIGKNGLVLVPALVFLVLAGLLIKADGGFDEQLKEELVMIPAGIAAVLALYTAFVSGRKR